MSSVVAAGTKPQCVCVWGEKVSLFLETNRRWINPWPTTNEHCLFFNRPQKRTTPNSNHFQCSWKSCYWASKCFLAQRWTVGKQHSGKQWENNTAVSSGQTTDQWAVTKQHNGEQWANNDFCSGKIIHEDNYWDQWRASCLWLIKLLNLSINLSKVFDNVFRRHLLLILWQSGINGNALANNSSTITYQLTSCQLTSSSFFMSNKVVP